MANLSPVFCDAATITVEANQFRHVTAQLMPLLTDMGCTFENSPTDPEQLYKSPSQGSLKVTTRHAVTILSASGQFLADLRAHKLLNDYLMTFLEIPHNVSSADFTVDEYCNPASRFAELQALVRSERIQFTRKAIPYNSANFRCQTSPAFYDTTRDTGTLYIGRRGNTEVHSKHYDKTQERHSKGVKTKLDTFRHELTISGKMGICLKDIASPASVFWHFFPQNILSAPAPYPAPWVSGKHLYSPPLELERVNKLAGAKIISKVQYCHDLISLYKLADLPESGGINHVLNQIRQRYEKRHLWDSSHEDFKQGD